MYREPRYQHNTTSSVIGTRHRLMHMTRMVTRFKLDRAQGAHPRSIEVHFACVAASLQMPHDR